MSFPEYLKERISEDYKNLLIQKLEELKEQTDALKARVPLAVEEVQRSLQERLQREIVKIGETIAAELEIAQQKLSGQLESLVEDYFRSWYHSDVSPFQQQMDLLISDIVSNMPAPPKEQNEDLNSLTQFMNKLDQGNTQSEILNIVLQHISGWVNRAVLWVVKGDQATAWAAMGLGSGWDANRIRQLKVSLSRENILREVIRTGGAVYGPANLYADDRELFGLLGDSQPETTLAFPIFVRGKIAGILYADLQEPLSEKPDLPNLLFLACRAAGFAIDLLPMKPKTVAASAVAPSASSAPAVSPTPSVSRPAAQAPPKVEEEDQRITARLVASSVQTESPAEEAGSTVMMQSVPEAGSTVVMPAPSTAAIPLSEEEQKLHDDARRFARLLVSEIKLYNEAQVAAGRENRDLYERLKDDIERSRRMYMDRVPAHIHSTTNYFYEELVRTLANGDPSLLGM